MKLSELQENWLKQKLLHAFGKVSAEDIVDGAEFSVPGDRASEQLLGTHIIRIVDELGDKASYVYVLDNGNVFDPHTSSEYAERLDLARLYDGDPEIAAKLKKRAAKPAPRVKREFKSVLARFINDNNGKRIQ